MDIAINTEQQKYERMWSHIRYREVAPGEGIAIRFLQQAKPKAGASVIDFGAGTGRGSVMLAIHAGVNVHMLDFAENCLDEFVKDALQTQPLLKFTQHDLTQPCPIEAEYGYCTDVMEHIPPEQVDKVLSNILRAAEHVFFQIACEDDTCGKLIGETLHLSVHDYSWWLKKLQAFDCVVHWSEDYKSHCMFYVTAWQNASTFIEHGILNTTEAELLEHVKTNIAGEWKQAFPHATNDMEVAILAGGPSLNAYAEELRDMKKAGVKMVTLNGAYNWAQEQGLWPVSQIVVDGREFNSRFTKPVDEKNMYLIASQVHPSVLDSLPPSRTFLWHTNIALIKEELDKRYSLWFNTPGGSTVLLRAIPLLRMLGYKKFHLYGCDSCLDSSEPHNKGIVHHAYAQTENDKDLVMPVTCGDRIFHCHPWMACQASEFMDLIKVFGDEIELSIAGDGLLAHILTTGALMAEENEIELP